MADRVMRTMVSRGLRIVGSGTCSTRTSLTPYQQRAFTFSSLIRVPFRLRPASARRRGLGPPPPPRLAARVARHLATRRLAGLAHVLLVVTVAELLAGQHVQGRHPGHGGGGPEDPA